jgi:serine/threonine-protein kinase ATR
MHFEQFIEKSQQDPQLHLNSIQRLYWALNEPDGVVGVAAVRKCAASLEEEILEHKSAGGLFRVWYYTGENGVGDGSIGENGGGDCERGW